MAKTIRICIVGAGLWGEAHAGLYQEHPCADPVAVCDLNLEKATALAEKFGIRMSTATSGKCSGRLTATPSPS